MSLKRPASQTFLDAAFTAYVPPIGAADLALVRAAMAECATEWSVELEGIRAEESTLILLPEDAEDVNGPSFMISRETYGLRIDQVHWDALTEIGVYASIADVVDVLRLRLAFSGTLPAPASITLH